MNDDSMREAAAERLLTAELAAVLKPGAAAKAIAWWPRWAAAAVAMFGLLTVLGVAALRAREGTFAQQPAFDPLAPSYEQFLQRFTMVARVEQLAEIPADAQDLMLTRWDEPLLGAVARRRPLRSLEIRPESDSVSVSLGGLTEARDLVSLLLRPPYGATELRELRHVPRLQHLFLLSQQITFDRAVGEAVAEARFLRTLYLAGPALQPEGIAALASLSDLECLILQPTARDQGNFEWLQELPNLGRLKGLGILGSHVPPDFHATLAKLESLRLLELGSCDDRLVAALPQKIERLVVSDLEGASETAILALAKRPGLRGLGFRDALPKQHQAVDALLRTLPLERFDSLAEAPTPELWRELQAKPQLRHLKLAEQGSTADAIFEAAAKCSCLEVLELKLVGSMPSTDSLRPLAELRHLRRIRIDRGRNPGATTPDTTDFRALFEGRVEIRVH